VQQALSAISKLWAHEVQPGQVVPKVQESSNYLFHLKLSLLKIVLLERQTKEVRPHQATSLIGTIFATHRSPRFDWSYWCSRSCGCNGSNRDYWLSGTTGRTRSQWSLHDRRWCCCDMQRHLCSYDMHHTRNSM
jgi:hypothetical protein